MEQTRAMVTPDEFRHALSRFASGVTVVTACSDGVANGSTVSAFCSVSLIPPLVLVCLSDRSLTCELVAKSGRFAVSVLREDQIELARLFAGRAENKIDAVQCLPGESGAPLLQGALAYLECKVVETCAGGDHTVFIAEVASTLVGEGSPLLYFEGGYTSVERAGDSTD